MASAGIGDGNSPFWISVIANAEGEVNLIDSFSVDFTNRVNNVEEGKLTSLINYH